MAGLLDSVMTGPKSKAKPLAPVVEGDDLDTVAQELIDAVKAGDVAGVKDALRSAHSICSNSGEE